MEAQQNYGSTTPLKKSWNWAKRGDTLQVFSQVLVESMKQFAALAVVAWAVSGKRKYLMTCDSRTLEAQTAIACEYTKAYLRGFPLVACTVTITIALMQVLRRRIFYELLRRNILLDFRDFHPFYDPLFLLLVFCLSQAAIHFVLEFWAEYPFDVNDTEHNHMSQTEWLLQVKASCIEYMVPACVFMKFLWDSYDTEKVLLPIGKYFQEDPEYARKTLGSIPFIQERDLAMILSDYHEFQPDLFGQSWRFDEACELIVSRARYDPSNDKETFELELVSGLWPSILLLDGRFNDESSNFFRRVWYFFWAISVIILLCIFGLFIHWVFMDFEDVRDGQLEDIASLCVMALSAVFVCSVLFILTLTACRSLRFDVFSDQARTDSNTEQYADLMLGLRATLYRWRANQINLPHAHQEAEGYMMKIKQMPDLDHGLAQEALLKRGLYPQERKQMEALYQDLCKAKNRRSCC